MLYLIWYATVCAYITTHFNVQQTSSNKYNTKFCLLTKCLMDGPHHASITSIHVCACSSCRIFWYFTHFLNNSSWVYFQLQEHKWNSSVPTHFSLLFRRALAWQVLPPIKHFVLARYVHMHWVPTASNDTLIIVCVSSNKALWNIFAYFWIGCVVNRNILSKPRRYQSYFSMCSLILSIFYLLLWYQEQIWEK